jgi:flagellar biogenesis protein FliO
MGGTRAHLVGLLGALSLFLAIVTALIWILIAYETRSYGENRARVRHEDFAHEAQSS